MIDTTIDQCRSNGRFLYVNLGHPVFLGFFFTCSGRERSGISDSAFVDYVKKPIKSVMHGQGDAQPTVTFPAVGHHVL